MYDPLLHGLLWGIKKALLMQRFFIAQSYFAWIDRVYSLGVMPVACLKYREK